MESHKKCSKPPTSTNQLSDYSLYSMVFSSNLQPPHWTNQLSTRSPRSQVAELQLDEPGSPLRSPSTSIPGIEAVISLSLSLSIAISESFLPSGNFLHGYGKSPCFMGKSTISMAIFNSFLYVYQAGYPLVISYIAPGELNDPNIPWSPRSHGFFVGILWGYHGIYIPGLVNIQKTIENDHLVRWFTH